MFQPTILRKKGFHQTASHTYKHPETTSRIQHHTRLVHLPWPKERVDEFKILESCELFLHHTPPYS